ncbi:MAG: DUF1178 family protein [Sphingomonadales bacterium]|nr:DUF1178 family protein [Sphingomonadales bacterium]NCQ20888.1 DUF1178 family protein [Sphingomonadales bacterium]NCT02645.1 DUF1178 family protein [Sphingomonadales bacterium]
MIVFDLSCSDGHRFEGWFASSADFEDQRTDGLLACPFCGSVDVIKAPMAPAVPAKGNSRQEVLPPENTTRPVANTPMPAEVQQAFLALAKAQAAALKNSTWVGDKFAEETRRMHYGERDEAPIHGQASLAEAKALIEEGVPIAPLPFPVAPPEKLN